MSEKVLHRVAKTDVLRGWSVKQDRDDGPLHARYDDINYSVDRYELVKELARLAARIAELEAENAKLRACLAEARLAMMEPHGEWKDVREAKALNTIRAEMPYGKGDKGE